MRILNEGYENSYRATEARNQYIKVDNQWLIDTSMGAGTHIFGHGAMKQTIQNEVNTGSLFIIPNKNTDACGELLHLTTKFENFVFCNSGSEATLRAIRIARAYTKRDKILLFSGYWHGTHDWSLTTQSKGIPQAVKDLVIVLPLNELSLRRLHEKDIALAMIEPVQSSLPINQQKFLLNLRQHCTATGTVLCFDEVISGFRMALGGATSYFNITPDLVTYGKIIGGGLPVGIVGGNDVMDVIKTGVRMGGTFSANPLVMSICRRILLSLLEANPYEALQEQTQKLTKVKSKIAQVIGLGSMARLLFTTQKIQNIEERDQHELPLENRLRIINNLRKEGVYINSNNAIMLSTAHTDDNLKTIIQSLENITVI